MILDFLSLEMSIKTKYKVLCIVFTKMQIFQYPPIETLFASQTLFPKTSSFYDNLFMMGDRCQFLSYN